MKNKDNKKGFTLIEIIATVAILGILAVIGIVSVSNIINKGEDEYYETLEDNVALTTESYTQTNRDSLPKNVGESKNVPVSDLVDENYIEKIKDYYGEECDLEKSYVKVFKYNKNSYTYVTYLDCPNYNNEEKNNSKKPTIKITLSDDSNNVKKTSATVKITDDYKLLSYIITIYKNNKEVYTTGNIEANYETIITTEKNIAKYTPGEIKVVVKAINIYGQETTESKTKTYKDRQKPECIISEEDSSRTNEDWINGNRTITVGCDDGEEGSGCARDEFTKTFKTDAKTDYITIKDKEGNETKCEVDVYIDKTNPSACTVTHSGTKGTNDWYVTNAKVTLTSSDAMSGIKYKSLTTQSNLEEYNQLDEAIQSDITNVKWYGYVEDYAGNKTNCFSTNFKVDTTPPTQPSGGTLVLNGSTVSTTLGEVSGSTDDTSGLYEYRYLVIKDDATYPENTSSSFKTSRTFNRSCGKTYYAYAIAVDKAGNKSSVYRIGIASDGKDEYSAWTTCSASCGGGTQTRTNTCALITTGLEQECEKQDCCSSVRYVDGTTCSAPCGNGTYNQLAYSNYDNSRCEKEDKKSGGSSCFIKSCCTESTTYGEYGSCTCTGGGTCTKTRTKTVITCNNGVATTTTGTDSTSCSYPTHTHDYTARGGTLKNTSFTWTCTRGHSHTTGYYIYCRHCGKRPTSGATLVCPTNPYGTAQGWLIIPD